MLYELLLKYRTPIVSKWIVKILDSYSSESSKFLNREKNQFSNPVGSIISSNAESIYDEIISNSDFEKIKLQFTDIIKIRAVQDFPPSEAVNFVFYLKDIIRNELKEELTLEKVFDQFVELEAVIDKTALVAFDLYMEAREKIFQIRMNEARYNLQKVKNSV